MHQGGEKLKDLKERVSEISSYLQRLMESDVFPDVLEAVRKSDKDSLVNVCKEVDVPDMCIGSIVSLIFALSLPLKYPVLI